MSSTDSPGDTTPSAGRGRGRGRGMVKPRSPNPETFAKLGSSLSSSVLSRSSDAEQSSHSSPADSPSRQLTRRDYDDSPCATENSDPTQESSKSVTSSLNINADVFVPQNTKQNTSLSADAPEFIPKPLSADAQEFVPRKNIAAGDGEASDTSNLSGFEEDCVFIVEQVQYTLSQLSSSPSSLDYLASSLRETLAAYQTNDSVLLSVIDLIVQQAISDRNLRYSAARLCSHLCTSLVAVCDSGLGTFRSHLMNRCRDEFNKASVNLKSPETVSKVYGFTQFIGEIYLSLLIKKADGSSARVAILQTKILELLVLLSTLPTTDGNIKCVVQTLKFCGSAIEDDLRIAGDSTGLDNLFELLRLVMLEKFSSLTKEIIANLVDLRSNNWGRNTSTPSPTTSEHFEFRTPSPFSQTEPVFYNDKGQVITREEAGFASNDDAQLYIPDESSADNDYGVWSEASLDVYEDADEDEIAEAFEQFMIESEQSGT